MIDMFTINNLDEEGFDSDTNIQINEREFEKKISPWKIQKIAPTKTSGSFFDQDFTSSTIDENQVNEERIQYFENKCYSKLINILQWQDMEYGCISEAEEYINSIKSGNLVAFYNWLNKVFIRNLHNPHVTLGILYAISHMPYEEVYPNGPLMAMTVMSHNNIEIREAAIRVFEQWDNKDQVSYLKSIRIEEKWLDEYLKKVISNIENK